MRIVSEDGLLSSSDPNAVALWNDIGRRMEAEGATMTERLRAIGVKLAHPDDGWNHRPGHHTNCRQCQEGVAPSFTLSWYPLFNDRPEVGDLIAFGQPWEERYIVGRVTAIERGGILIPSTTYEYEIVGEFPERPKRTLRDRLLRRP